MVTKFTEHTRSRNMQATFKENPETIVFQVVMLVIYTEHTRSRNMNDNGKGNPKQKFTQL